MGKAVQVLLERAVLLDSSTSLEGENPMIKITEVERKILGIGAAATCQPSPETPSCHAPLGHSSLPCHAPVAQAT